MSNIKATYMTPWCGEYRLAYATVEQNKPKHILLVEDHPLIQITLQKQLQEIGYHVTLAASGEEAIDCFDADIDLVIMDIGLPGISGIEATKQIREKYPQYATPIVAHTANTDKETQAEMLAAGIDKCITKGPSTTQLKNIIENQLTSNNYSIT